MTSSKKSRGKQRIQRRNEKRRQCHDLFTAQYLSMAEFNCKHGIPELPPQFHDMVTNAMKYFLLSIIRQGGTVISGNLEIAMCGMAFRYPDLFEEGEAMESFIQYMIIQGTNFLLLNADEPDPISALLQLAKFTAAAVMKIEDPEENTGFNKYVTQLKDPVDGDFRKGTMNFFANRINCDCLKSMMETNDHKRTEESMADQQLQQQQQQQIQPTLTQQEPQERPAPVSTPTLYWNNKCTHGQLPKPCITAADFDAVKRAYNRYILAANKQGKNTVLAIHDVKREFPEIIAEENKRSLLKALIISFGANLLLNKHSFGAKNHAVAILALEYIYVSPRNNISKGLYHERCIAMYGGGEREVTKFYTHRTSCNCLKEMWNEVKQQPKRGKCANCKKQMKLNTLLRCARCKTEVYCGEACGKSHWPEHKYFCDAVKTEQDEFKKEWTSFENQVRAKTTSLTPWSIFQDDQLDAMVNFP